MEKEALLDIILQDLKELDKLLRTFSGKDHIPEAFIDLAKSKVNGIANEVDLLGTLTADRQKATLAPPASSPATTPASDQSLAKTATTQVKTSTEPNPQAPPPPKTLQPEEITPDPVPEVRKEKTPTPVSSTSGKQGNEKKVLGEMLGQDRTSFNETLGNGHNSSSKMLPPIADLKKALGINDRFFYQRELFNGSAEQMNQTLDQLNQMDSHKSALSFISANFKWDSNQEAYLTFMNLLERRFNH